MEHMWEQFPDDPTNNPGQEMTQTPSDYQIQRRGAFASCILGGAS